MSAIAYAFRFVCDYSEPLMALVVGGFTAAALLSRVFS